MKGFIRDNVNKSWKKIDIIAQKTVDPFDFLIRIEGQDEMIKKLPGEVYVSHDG